MATFKRVNPLSGRTPHKKATRATYTLTVPKGAFTEAKIEELKKEFASAGIRVIWLVYSEHAVSTPRFEKI